MAKKQNQISNLKILKGISFGSCYLVLGICKSIALLFGGLVLATGSLAQTFSPIAVTGFNQDGVAESGIDATAVTTTSLDLSTYIMYSTIFAAINGLQAGLPTNGTIVSGNRTWQLQPYTSNNVLYLSSGGSEPNTTA